MKFSAITTVLATAFATSEARISEKGDTKERRLDGEWGSAGSMSMPTPVALDSFDAFKEDNTETLSPSRTNWGSNNASSLSSGSNNSFISSKLFSKSGKMPNYEIKHESKDIFYSNIMQLGEEDIVARLIWQEGPLEVFAACDLLGPYVWVHVVAETEDIFLYASYLEWPSGEVGHYVGYLPKGEEDGALMWFADASDSGILNRAGVGAITAIGVESGKTYYFGLEGESFIGYQDDLKTCFLSGVYHVSG